MVTTAWLIVDRNGVKATRKTKPALDWDEIAIKVVLDIPNQLFNRPSIEAKITVADIPNTSFPFEVSADTVDLIEQQTGAKINFTVAKTTEEEEKK